MENYIVRVISKEAGLRGLACITTGLANEVSYRHKTSPTGGAALGHGLTSAVLMGALLKVKQRVALKFEGRGPLSRMIVESDSYGRTRGYVSPNDVTLPEGTDPADVAAAIGDLGLLTVVKDVRLKELYNSVVPLQTGQVDKDLHYYLTQSEQIPTAVKIGVSLSPKGSISAAAGLLIQAMPGKEENLLPLIAQRIDALEPLENLINEGQTPEQILAMIFEDISYDTLETREIRFECNCSWERTEKALLSLGREELASLLEEGEAVVDCHFCGQQYTFSWEALETILEKIDD